MMEFSTFSKKQRQILNWWSDDSPVKGAEGIVADGAIRSGKTVSMSLSFVIWAMANFNGQNFGMCGKTIGSFRRNVLLGLKSMLTSRGYEYKENRIDNLFIVSRGGIENRFYIFGGKDERSQDLVQGITLAGCFFDEAALMPESFVNQATGRCSVKGSKFWFNCNPEGPYHWFKTDWIDRANDKRLLYLHFTMNDNLSLSDDIRRRYESMYAGVFYKRYILGLWCMAEGVIYDMFDTSRHVFKGDGDTAGKYFVSCDYGTQNATVFLLWRQGKDSKWKLLKEYYYSGRENLKQKTDREYADDLVKWLDGILIERIIIDPSAASFIAEIKERGFRVKRAVNDVIDGIRYVSSLLNKERIMISDTCKNTLMEFASYVWDDKAADRGEDKPLKQSDHAMDALRYFCNTVIRKPSGVTFLQ